jgi:alanine racemase
MKSHMIWFSFGIDLRHFHDDKETKIFLVQCGKFKVGYFTNQTIEKGESVQRSEIIATKTTKIATILIGYADGICRS